METLIIPIIGTIGLILIILGNYYKISYNKFKNNGIKTNFKVIEVTTEHQVDINDNITGEIYITTFEFTYNNRTLTEKIQTKKCFDVGEKLEGIYLPGAKLNKIMVAGEGFQMAKGVEWVLIILGLLLISIVITILLINTNILFPVLGITLTTIPLGSIIIINILSKK